MKLLKIKTQNIYTSNIDGSVYEYEVDDNAVIGVTSSTTFETDRAFGEDCETHVKLELFGLWIKCKHIDDSGRKKTIPYITHACTDKFITNDGDFIGFIPGVYDIEYDGKLLTFDEINKYFQDFFADKLIIHDSYKYGILSIFRFVSLDNSYRGDSTVHALHLMLRDCFRDGKSVFTMIFQDFKFDAVFRDMFGHENFNYETKLTDDKSIKDFFNMKMSKLFEKLTVK